MDQNEKCSKVRQQMNFDWYMHACLLIDAVLKSAIRRAYCIFLIGCRNLSKQRGLAYKPYQKEETLSQLSLNFTNTPPRSRQLFKVRSGKDTYSILLASLPNPITSWVLTIFQCAHIQGPLPAKRPHPRTNPHLILPYTWCERQARWRV